MNCLWVEDEDLEASDADRGDLTGVEEDFDDPSEDDDPVERAARHDPWPGVSGPSKNAGPQ